MAKKLPVQGTPEWHQLQIAKKTIKMTPTGAMIMGGMSIKEAKIILDQYEIKYADGGNIGYENKILENGIVIDHAIISLDDATGIQAILGKRIKNHPDGNRRFENKILENGLIIDHSVISFETANMIQDFLSNKNKVEKEGNNEINSEIDTETYFRVVNHFVYFSLNYPNNFMDAFGDAKGHLTSKFDSAYEKAGSYGAMFKLWTDLDSKNRKDLCSWVKENYRGFMLRNPEKISVDTYCRVVNHFVMFSLNYPKGFLNYEGGISDEHATDKFNSAYKIAGSWGAMAKFWVELDTHNRFMFAAHTKVTYNGEKLEKGGSLDDLKQSSEFVYRGYKIKRNQFSHTQGAYSVFDKDGKSVMTNWNLEAPYDKVAMIHRKDDGRENEYLKTDIEIKNEIDSVFSNVEESTDKMAEVGKFALGGNVFNSWQVYYMDNDGKKVVIEKGLPYYKAVKLSGEKQSEGLGTQFESIEKEGKGTRINDEENYIWKRGEGVNGYHVGYEAKIYLPSVIDYNKEYVKNHKYFINSIREKNGKIIEITLKSGNLILGGYKPYGEGMVAHYNNGEVANYEDGGDLGSEIIFGDIVRINQEGFHLFGKSGVVSAIYPEISGVHEKDVIYLTDSKGKLMDSFFRKDLIKKEKDFRGSLELMESGAETEDKYNPFHIPVYKKGDNVYVFAKDIEPIWIKQQAKRVELNKIVDSNKEIVEKLKNKTFKDRKKSIELINQRYDSKEKLQKAIEKAESIPLHVSSIIPKGMSLIYFEDGKYIPTSEFQALLSKNHYKEGKFRESKN